jgi:hypothetical protein
MPPKLLFFLSILTIYCTGMAQPGYETDSISLNGNIDHVFYSLENGTKNKITKKTWDIAFANEKHESGIRINDLGGVRLWKTNKDTTAFSAVVLADTFSEKFNSPAYFFKGAFDDNYQVLNANNDFQIGWGVQYLSLGNIINGDSVFIIKGMDGIYRKLFIKYRISPERRYIVRIANMDNSNTHDWIVRKNFDSTTTYLSCYNLSTEAQVNNTEPNYKTYDLIFRDYTIGKTYYPMSIMLNNTYSLLNNLKSFTGDTVYKNFNYVRVPAYELANNPIVNATYNNSLSNALNFTNNNYIGVNWLNTATNAAKPDYSYFVRDRNGCVWHLAVKEYKPTNNEIVFLKKKLSVCYAAIDDPQNDRISQINIYPIPTKINEKLFISLNEREMKAVSYRLINAQGHIVQSGTLEEKAEISTAGLSAGLYVIQVDDKLNQNSFVKKLIIE